jgi:chorismate mutase
MDPQDVAAAIFTSTEDLSGSNPAAAARAHGWGHVPLLAVREHPADGETDLPGCIRLLVLWNTPLSQADVHHVYLRDAEALRPDLGSARYPAPQPQGIPTGTGPLGGERWSS